MTTPHGEFRRVVEVRVEFEIRTSYALVADKGVEEHLVPEIRRLVERAPFHGRITALSAGMGTVAWLDDDEIPGDVGILDALEGENDYRPEHDDGHLLSRHFPEDMNDAE